jgi:hypothetical protein
MGNIRIASVEPGQAIIFNAGRKILCQRVTTTFFLHLDALLYEVSDNPVDQKSGKRMATIHTPDYHRRQHQEGALTMGGANVYTSPKEYSAVSSGEIIEWTVSVAKFQPTVSDNQSSFKFVNVFLPEADAAKFVLKSKLDIPR